MPLRCVGRNRRLGRALMKRQRTGGFGESRPAIAAVIFWQTARCRSPRNARGSARPPCPSPSRRPSRRCRSARPSLPRGGSIAPGGCAGSSAGRSRRGSRRWSRSRPPAGPSPSRRGFGQGPRWRTIPLGIDPRPARRTAVAPVAVALPLIAAVALPPPAFLRLRGPGRCWASWPPTRTEGRSDRVGRPADRSADRPAWGCRVIRGSSNRV